jgi:hypothetical protein
VDGILAPTYAPDANVIGVAALAPASDLPGLVGNLDEVTGGSIFASPACDLRAVAQRTYHHEVSRAT